MKVKEVIITALVLMLVGTLYALNYVANKYVLRADTIYRVYLNGEIIGYLEDDQTLYNIINKKQAEIKKKYAVDNVYPPEGFQIIRSNSYNVEISSAEEIYERMATLDTFTIEGYTIKAINEEENKEVKINVLDESTFDDAIQTVVLAFIDENEYQNYLNDTQPEIKTTGKLIELMYFDEKITIKKGLVSVNEPIYTDVSELSQYLLFGKDYKISYYTVKEGDTIKSISETHKLNAYEFLIVNPNYTDEGSMLKIGDKVNITLINPVLTFTYEVHEVSDSKIPFQKKVKYDRTKPNSFSEITTAGVTGITRVTEKYIVKNGETQQGAITTNKEVLVEKVDQITTKGGYYSGGTGGYIDTGLAWGWPTNQPCKITSYFGYRGYGEYRGYHDAVDISGTGYGSPIYATADGTVISAGYQGRFCTTGGVCVVIEHSNGYHSLYAHMAMGSLTVKVGDTVTKGQIIGAMGNTGSVSPKPSANCPTCGTHLHFSIYAGIPYRSQALNPLSLANGCM